MICVSSSRRYPARSNSNLVRHGWLPERPWRSRSAPTGRSTCLPRWTTVLALNTLDAERGSSQVATDNLRIALARRRSFRSARAAGADVCPRRGRVSGAWRSARAGHGRQDPADIRHAGDRSFAVRFGAVFRRPDRRDHGARGRLVLGRRADRGSFCRRAQPSGRRLYGQRMDRAGFERGVARLQDRRAKDPIGRAAGAERPPRRRAGHRAPDGFAIVREDGVVEQYQMPRR